MLVGEKMRACARIHPDATLAEVSRLLRRSGGRPLIVQRDFEAPSGVVTEQELCSAIPSRLWALRPTDAERLEYLESVSARSICREVGPCIHVEATATEAYSVMREHGCSSLPVMQNGRAIGLISLFDFIDNLLKATRAPTASLFDALQAASAPAQGPDETYLAC